MNKSYDTSIACPAFVRSYTSAGNSSFVNISQNVLQYYARNGQALPNHLSVIRNGGDATTPFSIDATRLYMTSTTGKTVMISGANTADPLVDTHEFSGVLLPIQTIQHVITQSMGDIRAQALKKLYANIREQRSYFNGMTFLGELKESIHMLRHPLESLAKNLRHVVNTEKQTVSAIRKLRSAVKRRDAFAKMVSGTALEINFGWRPFVNDVRDIAVAIAKHQYRPPTRDRLRSSATEIARNVITLPRTGVYDTYQLIADLVFKYETSYSVMFTCGLNSTATAAYSAAGRLADEFGLTPENILPAAWELTPWSWLADYFTNIGDIIEAGATNTSGVSWICESTRIKTTLTRTSTGVLPFERPSDPNARYVASFSGLNSETRGIRTQVTRNKLAEIPPLSLTFKTPFESATRVTNLLAVMEQQRKSVRF